MLVNSICTGRLAYNCRRFKVHKQTGRRVAVRNAEADHLVHQDERLRIIDDELFQQAQQRLAGRRRGRPGPYLRAAARPFTGLIFCETCGSICYRRKSKNAKGEYHYCGCGCRQRHGPDACENTASIREDLLLQEVARTFKDLFEDADSIIEEATAEAKKLVRKNRGEVRRIGGQLGEAFCSRQRVPPPSPAYVRRPPP